MLMDTNQHTTYENRKKLDVGSQITVDLSKPWLPSQVLKEQLIM